MFNKGEEKQIFTYCWLGNVNLDNLFGVQFDNIYLSTFIMHSSFDLRIYVQEFIKQILYKYAKTNEQKYTFSYTW